MPRYLVLGMGKTGLSIAQHLNKNEINAIYFDTRINPPELEAFKKSFNEADIYLVDHNNLPEDIDTIVVSPGINDDHPIIQLAIQRNIQILSDIDLFVRSTKKDFIAITGSNGKSTVTELVSFICNNGALKASAGGNLGRPALDLLDDKVDIHILELSSFHLHRCQYLPAKVAVLLNISKDHLDWHGSEENYRNSKYRILKDALSSVYNRNLGDVEEYLNVNPKLTFGNNQDAGDQYGILVDSEGSFLSKGKKKLLNCGEIKLRGIHNYENLMAALAVSELINLDISDAMLSAKEFKGLPHRMQLVAEHNSIDFINDSKGTNVDAAMASINSIISPVILLAGGQGKGGDFKFFAESVHSKLKQIILFGEDAQIIGKEFENLVPIKYVSNLEEAISFAYKNSSTGDTILLSPACASFDQFDSYIHRGEEFTRIVKGLPT
jgi:UDP-N-acetylmuramoylalanine--D-glutamate ligase